MWEEGKKRDGGGRKKGKLKYPAATLPFFFKVKVSTKYFVPYLYFFIFLSLESTPDKFPSHP